MKNLLKDKHGFWYNDVDGNRVDVDHFPPGFFDRNKHLIYVGKSESGEYNDVVRLCRGSWDILDALVPRILWHKPGHIVEIGMGESTEILANHASKARVNLYSCDIEMGGMFKVFEKPLYKGHVCFVGTSENFIETFDFDFRPSIVFIDGAHNYEIVKKEIDFFLPLLIDEGILFMHDTFPIKEDHIVPDKYGRKPGDIYKVRQELERNPDMDVFTWPYSALGVGFTMVMKHHPNEQRKFWRQNGRLHEEAPTPRI
jgi:hypothetical protein